jgi:hypothetical protein
MSTRNTAQHATISAMFMLQPPRDARGFHLERDAGGGGADARE